MQMKKKKEVKSTLVGDLFRRYMNCEKISSVDVAKKLQYTNNNVNYMLRRPDGAWRVDEIRQFSTVVGVPMDLVIDELERYSKRSPI